MYDNKHTSNAGYSNPATGISEQAPRPLGNVGDQLEESMRLSQSLSQELEALEQRICAVLRQSTPQAVQSGEKPIRPVMSAHADMLSTLNSRLHDAVQHVRSLAGRADL